MIQKILIKIGRALLRIGGAEPKAEIPVTLYAGSSVRVGKVGDKLNIKVIGEYEYGKFIS